MARRRCPCRNGRPGPHSDPRHTMPQRWCGADAPLTGRPGPRDTGRPGLRRSDPLVFPVLGRIGVDLLTGPQARPRAGGPAAVVRRPAVEDGAPPVLVTDADDDQDVTAGDAASDKDGECGQDDGHGGSPRLWPAGSWSAWFDRSACLVWVARPGGC